MSEDEAKKLYDTVNGFWKSIKGGDEDSVFAVQIAKMAHVLMTGDKSTDEYWDRACKIAAHLTEKWKGDSFKEELIYYILKAAETSR